MRKKEPLRVAFGSDLLLLYKILLLSKTIHQVELIIFLYCCCLNVIWAKPIVCVLCAYKKNSNRILIMEGFFISGLKLIKFSSLSLGCLLEYFVRKKISRPERKSLVLWVMRGNGTLMFLVNQHSLKASCVCVSLWEFGSK